MRPRAGRLAALIAACVLDACGEQAAMQATAPASGAEAGASGAAAAGGAGTTAGATAGRTGAAIAGASGEAAGGAGTAAPAGAGGGGGAPEAGGSGTGGGMDAPADAGAGADAGQEPATGPFPPVSDFAEPGPYGSTTLTGTGPNGMYTVYVPEQPPPDGAGNPIVGWMSGGGTSHELYALLPHLASHGFVVVAANTIPGIGAEAELGQQILAGIEWAIAEQQRKGSALFGRLDTSKVASAGYSMGSLATFMIAADPRLTTTVHISGGNMAPERVNNLRGPAAFICGLPGGASCSLISAECDIAGANCATDFQNAATPVFYATFASGHLGILTSPFMERISAMTTAWLRWQLMGDATLGAKFVGAGCGYCSDPQWTVQQKHLE